jgi:ATP-dependent protease ClpP protease subunit
MTIRELPAIRAFERPDGFSWDAPSDALARWTPGVLAAAGDDPATISIFDVIGEDFWTGEGWTARRMAGVLRSIGKQDVVVSINSPGGDFFEGVAIYNQLREHPARVTVKVMGLAASAASLIAMAGDEIQIGRGAFLMVHNAWAQAVGNRHDMRGVADMLEPFDEAMSDIYAARTGRSKKKMAELLDAETWLNSAQAIDLGFADKITDDPAPAAGGASARADLRAKHQVDTLLAKAGVARSERRRLMRDLSGGTHDAAPDPATRDAGLNDVAARLRRLLADY